MDDIVKLSGISKGGIYWYFKSKEEIFLYLLEKEMERNQNEYVSLLNKNDTSTDKLHKYLNWYMQNAVNSSLHMLVAEFMTRVKSQDVYDRLSGIMAKKHTNTNVICEIIHKGIKNGEFSDINSEVLAELLSSLCDGIVARFCLFHKNSALLKKTFATAEDIFIKSIITQDKHSINNSER